MSFDAFSADPSPPKDPPLHDAVVAAARRRMARRRTAWTAAVVLAVVGVALPLALRSAGQTDVSTDRPTATQPSSPGTTVAAAEPIVVDGPGGAAECEAPVLVPSYLPEGFEPVSEALRYNADWQMAFAQGGRRIYVAGDVSGDWGDTQELRRETVRGYAALLAASSTEGTVTWDEPSPCASTYVTLGLGLDGDEVLRVAQSLGRRAETRPVGVVRLIGLTPLCRCRDDGVSWQLAGGLAP